MRKSELRRSDHPTSSELVRTGGGRLGQETTRADTDAAGLVDAFGLRAIAGKTLADARIGENGWRALLGMLRQTVFGRLVGYEDVNNGERRLLSECEPVKGFDLIMNCSNDLKS